jgi:hypothetical protein
MNALIGIRKYLREDYEEILNLYSDGNDLDETWEDWQIIQRNAKINLQSSRLNVVDITVKPRDIVNYCRQKGIDINSESRVEFISHQSKLPHE